MIIGVGLLAPTMALGLGELLDPNWAQVPRNNDESSSCTDFSGSWQGSCVWIDEGGSEGKSKLSLDVDQWRCKTITLQGETLGFGGTTSNSFFAPQDQHVTNTALVDWKPSRNEFFLRETYTGRALQIDSGHVSHGEYTMKLQEDKLLLSGLTRNILYDSKTGERNIFRREMTCTFDKAGD